MKQSLIDQVEFRVRAGNGGAGALSFFRNKQVFKGGPDGGDGGNGGSIYFVTNPHMTTLMDYAGKDHFEAESGERGRKRKQHGKDAEDMILEVPVGTVVFARSENDENNEYRIANNDDGWTKVVDMNEPGMKVLIARGGVGGRGNDAFKSSINTTPMYNEPGEHGEQKYLRLDLKILADIGLVGLPNAGKSTLLSVLTAARPEIANYPFTTITPNLGVFEARAESGEPSDKEHTTRQLIIADIPGLIEDAHTGKGLGSDFLRHIERCRVLVYVIAPMDEDLVPEETSKLPNSLTTKLVEQFETVRREVKEYGQGVDEKPRMIVINKADVLSEDQIKTVKKVFENEHEVVQVISAATHQGIEKLKEKLVAVST